MADEMDMDAFTEMLNKVAAEAIQESDDIKKAIAAINLRGVKVAYRVEVAVKWHEPNLDAARTVAKSARVCPMCTTPAKRIFMKGLLVQERPTLSKGERESISGLQIRFRCAMCSFSEVISLAVTNE